jgi:hypothetical protein
MLYKIFNHKYYQDQDLLIIKIGKIDNKLQVLNGKKMIVLEYKIILYYKILVNILEPI